jgi:hypothetical protein
MAAIIQIKRTLGSSLPQLSPDGIGVYQGELVYVYDANDVGSGKTFKKLYIGNPNGTASQPIAVGGEYYTDLLPESTFYHGILQSNKAIVVDANKKINELRADNIRIAVASTGEIDTDSGYLTLDSAGGKVIVDDNLEVSQNISIDGGNLNATTASFNLLNSTVTSLNAFGNATSLSIGSTGGTTLLRSSTLVGESATQNLYNTVASVINFGGGASTINIGNSSSSSYVSIAGTNNSVTQYDGALRVAGGVGILKDVNIGGHLDIIGDLYSTGNTYLGDNQNHAIIITGITTITGELNVDQIKIDGNVISSKSSSNNTIYIDPYPNSLSSLGTVIVKGNLQVDGQTVIENSSTLSINDPVIVLGNGDSEKILMVSVGAGTTELILDDVLGINQDDVITGFNIPQNTVIQSINQGLNKVILTNGVEGPVGSGQTIFISQSRADTYDRGIEYQYISSGIGSQAVKSIGFFGPSANGGNISTESKWTFIPNAIGNNNTFTGTKGYLDVSGIYYQPIGINSYSGPNGVGYFDSTGLLKSSTSTNSGVSTSNYILTTSSNNIPIWTDTIDGGSY